MQLKVLRTIKEMEEYAAKVHQAGKSIGLVPTMGALHPGHMALMEAAKAKCDVVIASVFVNPVQFGPQEDYEAYPRQFEKDCEKLEEHKVDAVFHPSVSEMYPLGYASFVTVEGAFVQKLCGAQRPGHFRGVATVVLKLFHLTRADRAFFGQKDAQQVVVIRRLVQDLHVPVIIEMVPIQRETDGLARSSRNAYLKPEDRKAAVVLYQSLQAAKKLYADGERSARVLREKTKLVIEAEARARLDYAEILTFPDLQETAELTGASLLAVAVKFGQVRLIDNILLGAETCC